MQTKDYLKEWTESRAYALAPRTIDSYRCTIRLHITPQIGSVDLTQLTPLQIERTISALCAQGKTRSALMVYQLLRTSLQDALRLGLISTNPMITVMRPRHHAQMRRWLETEELDAYLNAVLRDPHRTAWLLALCCGLRRGEIVGLRWGDVDLNRRMLHIRNQRIQLASGQIIDAPPKSASGERDIPLPDELLQLFRAAPTHRPSEYVIHKSDGQPITPNGLDKAHRQMIRLHGLPPVTPHGIRHTMATQAVGQGVHMRVLQQLLGHASYSTTANIYAHVDHSAAAAAVDKITRKMLKFTSSHPNS